MSGLSSRITISKGVPGQGSWTSSWNTCWSRRRTNPRNRHGKQRTTTEKTRSNEAAASGGEGGKQGRMREDTNSGMIHRSAHETERNDVSRSVLGIGFFFILFLSQPLSSFCPRCSATLLCLESLSQYNKATIDCTSISSRPERNDAKLRTKQKSTANVTKSRAGRPPSPGRPTLASFSTSLCI